MPGECKEGSVFFADTIENADGGDFPGGEADDLSPGTAEFALKRLDVLNRRVKMPFEEFLENVHEMIPTILLGESERWCPLG